MNVDVKMTAHEKKKFQKKPFIYYFPIFYNIRITIFFLLIFFAAMTINSWIAGKKVFDFYLKDLVVWEILFLTIILSITVRSIFFTFFHLFPAFKDFTFQFIEDSLEKEAMYPLFTTKKNYKAFQEKLFAAISSSRIEIATFILWFAIVVLFSLVRLNQQGLQYANVPATLENFPILFNLLLILFAFTILIFGLTGVTSFMIGLILFSLSLTPNLFVTPPQTTESATTTTHNEAQDLVGPFTILFLTLPHTKSNAPILSYTRFYQGIKRFFDLLLFIQISFTIVAALASLIWMLNDYLRTETISAASILAFSIVLWISLTLSAVLVGKFHYLLKDIKNDILFDAEYKLSQLEALYVALISKKVENYDFGTLEVTWTLDDLQKSIRAINDFLEAERKIPDWTLDIKRILQYAVTAGVPLVTYLLRNTNIVLPISLPFL